MIERGDTALRCHFIFINEFINESSDHLVVISFSNDPVLRGLHLYVHILSLSYELEELFKCGHSLSLAHIVSQHLLIRQIEDVNSFVQWVWEMMIQLAVITSVQNNRHAILCQPNLEELEVFVIFHLHQALSPRHCDQAPSRNSWVYYQAETLLDDLVSIRVLL